MPPAVGFPAAPAAPTLPPAARPEPAFAPAELTPVNTRAGGKRKLMLGVAALVGLGLIGGLVALMSPSAGTLVITVAGPGSKAVDSMEVLVDGTKKCEASPCRIEELAAGTHIVKVTAPGYTPSAEKAVKVEGGDEAVLNLTLAASTHNTGVRVSAEGAGLKLYVDGQEIGPLPAEVKDLSPGEHTIKVAGNDRYEPYEQRVTISDNQLENIGPLKLKVVKGLANIQPGDNADGAKVVLVSGSERRPIPSLPIKLDVTTDKSYTLEATRKGFDTLSVPIVFNDGEAERTFTISLSKEAEEEKQDSRPIASTPRSAPAPTQAQERPSESKPAATGMGKLNVNSIPVSKVIVDGSPRGQTPQVGLSVPAGNHTVVFVHPEHGRKVKTVNVPAGGTATAVVRFP